MTPGQHLGRIDLAEVVAPFQALGDHLRIAIEDANGRHLAGAPRPADVPDETAGLIHSHGELAGRIVLYGPGAATEVARAAASALGAALSAAASGAALQSSDDDRVATRRLEEELANGRRLQRGFVSLVPPEVPGYDIASHYEAATEIGGDFFDLFRMRRRGQPLSIVIADVTGKGIAAALVMAFSRPLLHAAIDHTPGPAAALERTNRILVGERRSTLFITALCARLEVRTGVLRMANAGHEPPLFVPGDGSPPGLVLGSGPLLGAFGVLDVPEVEVFMAPGDMVLFYTDGVTDARSETGERFDDARLLLAVERGRGGTAHDLVREICESVSRFAEGADPADDVTILAVGRARRDSRRTTQPRARTDARTRSVAR